MRESCLKNDKKQNSEWDKNSGRKPNDKTQPESTHSRAQEHNTHVCDRLREAQWREKPKTASGNPRFQILEATVCHLTGTRLLSEPKPPKEQSSKGTESPTSVTGWLCEYDWPPPRPAAVVPGLGCWLRKTQRHAAEADSDLSGRSC